jgi:hypothetical protein
MATKIPPNPYKVIPIPPGYRRALPTEISPRVQRGAVQALQNCLPIGKRQAAIIDGKLYEYITEGHYDDHVTAPGKPIWHPGISTIVPKVQPKNLKEILNQDLRNAQFTQSFRSSAMSGESGRGLWASIKNWLFAPMPTVTPRPVPKVIDNSAATALLLASRANGDPTEEDLESLHCGDGEDAVFGDDYGDDVGDDMGDEFGATRRRVKAKAKANIRFNAKLKATAGKRPAPRKPAPRPAAKKLIAKKPPARPWKPAARPAAKPVAKPTAAKPSFFRPAVTPAPATFQPSPVAPEQQMEEELLAPMQETPVQAAPEVEAAMDSYEAPAEETPETADEGSDTYDETAIGKDYCIGG